MKNIKENYCRLKRISDTPYILKLYTEPYGCNVLYCHNTAIHIHTLILMRASIICGSSTPLCRDIHARLPPLQLLYCVHKWFSRVRQYVVHMHLLLKLEKIHYYIHRVQRPYIYIYRFNYLTEQICIFLSYLHNLRLILVTTIDYRIKQSILQSIVTINK